jgi:acyl carrier protein
MNNQQLSEMMEHTIGIIRALAREQELPEYLVTAAIRPEDTIETLGIDSLGAVSLIERLEAELDIMLPDDFLDIADNIAGITRRLDEVVRQRSDMKGDNSESPQEVIQLCRVPTQ